MTAAEIFHTLTVILIYGGLFAIVCGIFVVLLYAVLRAMRWLWERSR